MIEALTHAADAAREHGSEGDLLRAEMREHHRLKSEGVIETPDYEAAKLRILSAHG